MAAGSWSLTEEMFAREDPAFVNELRRVHYASRLGDFAARWIDDPRPFARAALLDYLSRPLNCYRHEPLIKRLFKLAERAGDDELMGAFLAAFDRTICQFRKTRTRYKQGTFASQAEADAAVREWAAQGYDVGRVNNYSGRFYAYAVKQELAVVMPGNTVMPRPPERDWKKNLPIEDYHRQRLERRVRALLAANPPLPEAPGVALLPAARQARFGPLCASRRRVPDALH